jgi:DNA polymerase III epsilon subunit-like protein
MDSAAVNASHLRAFIERIEKLEEEKRAIADDIKDVYAEAKGTGFDAKILAAEFLRAGLPKITPARQRVCTMLTSTKFCALPGPYGTKWPKLAELHRKLFNEDFAEAHNAAADIAATARCFWELRRLGVIQI